MSHWKRLNLAWRMIRRDGRAGSLTVLAMAVLVAVAATTMISLFTDRLHRAVEGEGALLLGADLVLHGTTEVPPEWLQESDKRGLTSAMAVEFPSVIYTEDAYLLTSVKSVSETYPLKGQLFGSETLGGVEKALSDNPAIGTAWVESRILTSLNLSVGDEFELGARKLKISRVLTYEPDRAGGAFSLAPRVMISQADLAATKVIQPGSRVNYRYQFAGSADEIAAYQDWLDPYMVDSWHLHGLREDRPAAGRTIERAEQYLSLATLIAIILTAIAVAMSAHRYSLRHQDTIAMMRCLGASQADIAWLLMLQLIILGLLVGLVGCVLGVFAQMGLFTLLRDWFPPDMPAMNWMAVWPGWLVGQVILLGFALPRLLRLRFVPPLRVLRRDFQVESPQSRGLLLMSLLTASGLIAWFVGDWRLAFSFLLATLGLTVIIAALAFWIVRKIRVLAQYISPGWRMGLQILARHRAVSVGQITAFSLVLMVMTSMIIIRTDLLDTWRQQIPEQAPNHFAVNILPEQATAFSESLSELEETGIRSAQLYPIVRGRVVTLNGEPVRAALGEEKSERTESLNRELNLTWTTNLQRDNKIIKGKWWQEESVGQRLISLEQGVAEQLGVGLGDRLGFSVAGQVIEVEIASIRTVEWDSFLPNFYVIFPPQVLTDYAHTFLTSFYLPSTQKNALLPLIKDFPAVSIVGIDNMLRQIRAIVNKVTVALEYVLIFVFLAALVILQAAIANSIDERRRDHAVMRAMGASRKLLRRAVLSEFMVLGLIAGLLAVLGAEIVSAVLSIRVFKIDFVPHIWSWWSVPLVAVCLISLFGWLNTREVVNVAPVKVLRTLD